MQFRVFSLPAVGDGFDEETEKFNAFLRGHRILSVKQEMVVRDGVGFWSYSVEYLENGESGGGPRGGYPERAKVDYQKVLDAESFARFLRLRECRRRVAEEMHVPNYALWTDAVQAELAKLPELNKNAMMSVKGLGKGTFEKYGERILVLWKETENEKDRRPVRDDSQSRESETGVLEGPAAETK